jgi:hypothetical protein
MVAIQTDSPTPPSHLSPVVTIAGMANPDEVKKVDGKAVRIRKIQVDQIFLDAAYRLIFDASVPIGDTGLLAPFELVNTGGSPGFQGRWDEKAEALDIDIVGLSAAETREFKKGLNGNQGHHSVRIASDAWKFHVDIQYLGTRIFEANVHIGLDRNFGMNSGGKTEVSFSGDVYRTAD